MAMLFYILSELVQIYSFVLIVYVILSWLTAYNVVNPRNQVVMAISRITSQMCEPVLTPIRKMVPSFGGLDISPIILIILLNAVNRYILIPYSIPGML